MVTYLMQKKNELKHTVSKRKMAKLEAEGWHLVVTIRGFNISMNYKERG